MQIKRIGSVRKLSDEVFVIDILPPYLAGLHGILPGDRLDVHYWMHELKPEQRLRLQVHPKGDYTRPLKGVFGLRSPMRPNPIGVSTVSVKEVRRNELIVTALDANDGSPVVDIKAHAADAPGASEPRESV